MLSICMHVWFIYPLNGNWRPFENFKYEVVGTDNILRPKNFVTANKMEANS